MTRSEIRQKANTEMERRKLRAENDAAARQRVDALSGKERAAAL